MFPLNIVYVFCWIHRYKFDYLSHYLNNLTDNQTLSLDFDFSFSLLCR